MDFDTITDDEQKALLLIGNTIRDANNEFLDGDRPALDLIYYVGNTDLQAAFDVFGFYFVEGLSLATAEIVLDGILYMSGLCFADHAEYGYLMVCKGY